MEWVIEPCEPLIFRDGRPFDLRPGVQAISLPFPFPSTTAGAARSRAGQDERGIFRPLNREQLIELKKLVIRGPLLVEWHEREQEWGLLVPAPGDALLIEAARALPDLVKPDLHDRLLCRRLLPMQPFEQSWFTSFRGEEELQPVGMRQSAFEASMESDVAAMVKPASGVPAFWRWSRYEQWLIDPEGLTAQMYTRSELGIAALLHEQRIHVALEPGMLVSREGMLFETRGLEFAVRPERQVSLADANPLGLWLDVAKHASYTLVHGLDSLGAERRLVRWRAGGQIAPKLPDALCEQIINSRRCRILLLTPASFVDGYLPAFLRQFANVKVSLRGAVVQRPQIVSGWDMERMERKPTRRLVPAGSVFFLEFAAGQSEDALRAWLHKIWFSCISDDEQERFDGFGLAVPGVWSDAAMSMQQL